MDTEELKDTETHVLTEEEIREKIKHGRSILAGEIKYLSDHVAFLSFQDAANAGDPEGKALTAECLYRAKGTPSNFVEAYRLASESAETGNAEGQFILGLIFFEGRITQRDDDKAFGLLKNAAEQGHAEAQHYLGSCYYDGRGTEKDLYTAREWFRKAADNGYKQAETVLNGINKIIGEAERQDDLHTRADAGDAEAIRTIALESYKKAHDSQDYYNDLYREAEKWLTLAAENGDAECMFDLFVCRFRKANSTLDDNKRSAGIKEAFELLKKVAFEKGYGPALLELGASYQSGKYITKSQEEAFKCFEKGAEVGQIQCMHSLSYCYDLGRGTQEDLEKAIQWAQAAYDATKNTADSRHEYEDHLNKLRKKKSDIEFEAELAKIREDSRKEKEEKQRRAREEEELRRKQEAFSLDLGFFFEDTKFQWFGILAAVGVVLFTISYKALGAGLFQEPTIEVHGLFRFFLILLSGAGIMFCTYVSLLSVTMPIGLEGLITYPALICSLFIIVMLHDHPQIYTYTFYAAGAVIAINLLIIIFGTIIPNMKNR